MRLAGSKAGHHEERGYRGRGRETAALALGGAAIFLLACADDGQPVTDARAAIIDASPTDAVVTDGGAALLPETLPDPLPAGNPALEVLTYNVGLLQTVKGPTERLPLLIEAVRAATADVVCLQEVYTQYTSPEAFASAVAEVYPHSFWFWSEPGTVGNGLLILSKHPLYRGRSLSFAANDGNGVVDRAIIGATVVAPGYYAQVLCTHLDAAREDTIRLAEVAELGAWAQGEGYLEGPTLVLGDFNAGVDPITTDCECNEPPSAGPGPCAIVCNPAPVAAYTKLLETFSDPNADLVACTNCRATAVPMQLIPALFGLEPDKRIDHCLYRNLGTSVFVESERVLDEPQSIVVGTETLPALSDHFGLRCRFAPAE